MLIRQIHLQNAGLALQSIHLGTLQEIDPDAYIRDRFVQTDHQNVTTDHSFYLNYALLDGYFMSGLGIGSEWENEILKNSDQVRDIFRFEILGLFPIFAKVNGSKPHTAKNIRN